MRFFKYHGTGNDFVVVEAPGGRPGWATPETIVRICDRRFGVGADGVLLIEPGRSARFFMRVLNSDGSEAEMCGNGIRCVARHLHERMGVADREIPIETLAGVKRCRISEDRGRYRVAVNLGPPVLERSAIPVAGTGDVLGIEVSVLGREFLGNAVSMGNPHFVIFERVDREAADRYGAALSNSPLFPNQANIEFAEPEGSERFRVWVYERGCGITMACGTGAAATAVAAVLTGRARAGVPITMALPGGSLTLTVAPDLSDVVLEGPAVRVFEGELGLDALAG